MINSNDYLPPLNRWMSTSGLFLAGAMGTLVMLASIIKYNVTVKADATVRPSGEVRLVQAEIEGSVKIIEVKENQVVKQGDVIVRLNDEQLQIKKSQLEGNIEQITLQLVQIDAQIKTLDIQRLAESRENRHSVLSAQADLERNQKEYIEKQAITNSELLSAEASLQKARVDFQKAKADLAFANRDKLRYQSLVQFGAISKRDFDQKQVAWEQAKSIVNAEAKTVEIAQAKVKAAKAATLNLNQATITIAQKRIAQEQAKGEVTIATLNKERQNLLERRLEIQKHLQQTQKELQLIGRQLQSSIIRATSDGTILKLNLRNPNQIIRTSESVAEIAPNTLLVVKARVSPSEIHRIGVKHKVQMRVEACPYPDYGTLNGIVMTISPDAITPSSNTEATGNYFEATIQPEKLTFGNNRHQCQLKPGMEAKADIISHYDTILGFILRKARLLTDL